MRSVLLGFAGAAAMATSLAAHHSFAAYYFEDDTIEIEGPIVEVQFRAPHTWVHVLASDSFGRQHTYAAEWSNPSRLERDGITKDTLKAYDVVRIWGAPSRNPNDYRVHLKRIQRPRDGWEWKPQRRETR